jgi:hypothetical protein
MASPSVSRIGGNALLAGGILWVLAGLLHPDVSTLELATAVNRSRWILVHWAYLFGDVLLVGGLVLLFRYIASQEHRSNEGWAALAFAAGALGFTLDAASTAIHLLAFPPAGTDAASAQSIFAGAGAVNASIGAGGFALACLSLVILGLVLGRAGWTPLVAYGAIVVGGIELLLVLLQTSRGRPVIPAGSIANTINAIMPAWFVAIGTAFTRSSGAAVAGGARASAVTG